jgi:hypothetical protein
MNSTNEQERDTYIRRAKALVEASGPLTPLQKSQMLSGALKNFKPEELDEVNRKWVLQSRTEEEMKNRLNLLSKPTVTGTQQ